MVDVSARIYELRQTITHAALNYDVWWVFKSEETRSLYEGTMNRYPIFFQAAINAHFIALLVPLYRLFETRQDSHNIPQLIKTLRQEAKITEDKLDAFHEQYLALKPLWFKVNVLRNNVFGHRALDIEPPRVYRRLYSLRG